MLRRAPRRSLIIVITDAVNRVLTFATSPTAKTLGVLALCLIAAGNRPACDRRQPNVDCSAGLQVTVAPGSCVDITNPCDPSW